MYTIIFLREPYKVDPDSNDRSTDGVIGIISTESSVEARKVIRDYTKEQIRKERRYTNDCYGEWGFIVLKDGLLLEYQDIPSDIEFEHSGDMSTEQELNISNEVQLIYSYDRKCRAFISFFTQTEAATYKEFSSLYLKQEQERQERAKLAELLAKYPDMVDNNGS